LWGLTDYHNLAIIEAGVSKAGEMERLEEMIAPTYGVLTNIGIAHQEGFKSKIAKAEEKLQLFKNAETLIYPSKYLDGVICPYRPRKFAWGDESGNQLEVYSIKKQSEDK